MQWLKTERWVIVLSLKAPSTVRWRNLKTEVTLWKYIKCFPSTLRRRNLKTEVSLWKHIKCFPFTLRWRNLKTKQSPIIFDLRMRENRSGKSHHHRFRKASLSKCVLSTSRRKVGVFKFLRFEERFRKATFSWRIGVGGRPNRRHKATFSNSSGVVWMIPKLNLTRRKNALVFLSRSCILLHFG